MAKVSKEYQIRMEGYMLAYKFAKEHGLEALGKDIRTRGFLSIPVQIKKNEIDRFIETVTANLTNTMTTVMLMVLHDKLGFRKKRLQRMKAEFDAMTETIFDFDYLGQHYATLEDYAVFMNQKFGLGLDAERIAMCQDTCRYEKESVNMADINKVIEVLASAGYEDAAAFLNKKLE